jgi:prepilin-type N-terminal cleavage/methylation domain-containing protein
MSSRDRWGRLQAARWRGDRGVTLVEATIVLTVAAILAAAAAPVASRTLDRAKLARAADDTKAIKTAIDNFIVEFIGFTPFTTTGAAGGATVQLLVGDGDTPRTLGAGGAAQWDDPVNPAAAQPVDFLERHIVTNTPGGAGAYTTAGVNPWRGSYINAPIDPDPWGNRYAVNSLHLRTTTTNDVFVLSAGPDEEVNTAFTVNGATPGGDDIIAVIRRDPGRTVP